MSLRLRPEAVGLCYLYRACAGLLVASPWASAVGRVVGAYPRGDAMLFDEGGLMLLEVARQVAPQATKLGVWSALLALWVSFVWLLPLGALIASCGAAVRRRWRDWLASAGQALPPLMALLGASLLLQAVVLLGCSTVASYMARAVGYGGWAQLGVQLGAVGFALLLGWCWGLLHDAARVRIVQQRAGLGESLRMAVELLLREGRRMVLAAAWRTALGLAALLAPLALGLWLGSSGARHAVLLFFVQQLAVLVFVVLRASWFRWLSARTLGDADLR